MERFHEIPDGAVILRGKGGVYRQARVFRRGHDVFAAHGGGFVRLLRHSGTTVPSVTWIDLEADGVTVKSGLPQWAS